MSVAEQQDRKYVPHPKSATAFKKTNFCLDFFLFLFLFQN